MFLSGEGHGPYWAILRLTGRRWPGFSQPMRSPNQSHIQLAKVSIPGRLQPRGRLWPVHHQSSLRTPPSFLGSPLEGGGTTEAAAEDPVGDKFPGALNIFSSEVKTNCDEMIQFKARNGKVSTTSTLENGLLLMAPNPSSPVRKKNLTFLPPLSLLSYLETLMEDRGTG